MTNKFFITQEEEGKVTTEREYLYLDIFLMIL